MNKRIIVLALCGAFVAMSASAQNSASSQQQSAASPYKASYERQVRLVGAAGVGVETIVNRWMAAEPENPEAAVARFSYCLAKSQGEEIVQMDAKKYLGQKPVLTLKDSLGADVNYFNVPSFVDSLYADALSAIDKAISLSNKEMRYRFNKISALLPYERENPDMAAAELSKLLSEYYASSSTWTLDGEALDEDVFKQAVSEYCYSFFQIGSASSYEYFRSVSETMSKRYPKEVVFIDNLGSYWQVAQKNYRKALSYYKKALKLDPNDYAATTNTRIIERIQASEKAAKKKK